MTPFLPFPIGVSGRSAAVQPQLVCTLVMTAAFLEVFLNSNTKRSSEPYGIFCLSISKTVTLKVVAPLFWPLVALGQRKLNLKRGKKIGVGIS